MRRFSLSRRMKLCRNLLVLLLLFLLWWGSQGFGAFTGTGAFRRAERACLMPPSEILTELDGSQSQRLILGRSGDTLVLGTVYPSLFPRLPQVSLNLGPLDKDVSIVPVSYDLFSVRDVLVFSDRPDAAAAELTVTVPARTDSGEPDVYTCRGETAAPGLFVCEMNFPDREGTAYTLRLYDAAGALLGEYGTEDGLLPRYVRR